MTLKDVEFEVNGSLDQQEDILRCVRNIILTPAGSVPLDRDFGIDQSFLGYPIDAAKNLLAVEIIEKIEKYEPRVSVLEVDFTPAAADGQIMAKVVITNG